jgi:hypothetical protein
LEGPRADASWLERGVHRAVAKFMKPILEGTRHSHEQVHHGLTFRQSFTQMFDSPQHQRQVDDFIRSLGDAQAKEIWEENTAPPEPTRAAQRDVDDRASNRTLVAAGVWFRGAGLVCATADRGGRALSLHHEERAPAPAPRRGQSP